MTQIKLIDFEYVSYGPQEYDIANIINEMVIDNDHAFYPNFKLYYENFPSGKEIEDMMRYYL